MHDATIVGGGCIGCAVAKHLLEQSSLDVAVVEKAYHLAEHQSGRNSGVLHPGFNYEPGSLKAQFSTAGTRRLKAYANEHDIPLDECGVVVTALDDAEERRLHDLREQADENGVETEFLGDRAAIRDHEPNAIGQAAMYCPEAASIDSQEYVYALASELKNAGVDFYMGHRVDAVRDDGSSFTIETSNGTLETRYLVNAAGLHADELAHQLGVGRGYQIVPFRGEYYELVPERASLVESMIYPVPDPDLPFLGVHYTRRTDGKVIVGPNTVLAFGREAYDNTDVSPRELYDTLTYRGFWRLMASREMAAVAWDELNKSYRKEKFVEAAQRLLPGVEKRDFARSYAGIRAQVVSEDGRLVKEPVFEHGSRSTHVLNAVSPGLTCSLPFGDHLAGEVLENFE
ncbi:L-2-hydroxyglutarate oxidase [Halococcus salifodinae]|uniref:FAD dependent oxidoreductase n=1 Tax=Halococcus salifodinae DSM 8989 TaxID=1227456 RepID=M0NBE4_9EURY|nr:L-2-hydroxyglutarate oxidase [Halococcus salifodinae]EMA54414.1 FAD dependent oxidoreductase [Halococcus salifodinae DSM 8989]